jgi:hypothetical protein
MFIIKKIESREVESFLVKKVAYEKEARKFLIKQSFF